MKHRILAVEDTDFNRQFLKLSLRQDSYELILAENGAECLQILKTDQKFNLILMDIETPIISGLDACQIIKETYPPQVKKIPIIAVTGHNKPDYLKSLEEKGFSGHLTKPYQKADLLAIIEQFSTEITDDSTKPKESEYYDLSSLEEWASGDENMIRELVTVFVKDAPTKLKELKKAHNNEDWNAVQSIAHSFAPQLSFIGLSETFSETAKIEEIATEKSHTEQIEQLLKQVEITCKNAIYALKKDFQL